MKNSDFLNHLSPDDREEYIEIINQFKQEFKKKIQDEIAKIRQELSKNTAEILGIEFATLLNERKKLLQNFKESSKKLLIYAKELKLSAQLEKLQNWSTQAQKDNSARTEGAKLFQDVVEEVANHNPSIADEVKKVQLLLTKNSEQLVSIVKSKKELIDKKQKEFRLPLQKVIVDLLVEFNKKITVVNQSFNVQNTKPLSPFDEGDKISVDNELSAKISDDISEDFGDELFIPVSGDDDLN